MKLVIAPNRESEWTIPLIQDPSKYLGGEISPELEEHHPLAAIAEKARLTANAMISGDSVAESRLLHIFSRGGSIQKLESLLDYAREGGLTNRNKIYVETPDLPYQAKGSVALPDEFYVLPTFENGRKSSSRSLIQNKKIDLINEIWQALPEGYGVGIGNDGFGCQYYLSADEPSTELIDVEIVGNSRVDVVRGVIPFANRDYRSPSFSSKNPTLNRQIKFALSLGRYGGNNRVRTYRENFDVSMKKAKREIQELVDENVLKRSSENPWIVELKSKSA